MLKKKSVCLASWLIAPIFTSASANAPAAPEVRSLWNNTKLSAANYLVTKAQVYGSPSTVSSQEVQTILKAMQNDAAAAIKRRYPQATVVGATANVANDVVKLTPVLIVPNGLWPWSSVEVRMLFLLQNGQRVNLTKHFGVLELWNKSYDAANYAFDQMTQQLP